ncbi:MAG: DUF302 domain-containing protein [Gammaproteobacteria bacterium]|nr:DUF302 domain-containing protein [Gammaproteobacteria bacterium]
MLKKIFSVSALIGLSVGTAVASPTIVAEHFTMPAAMAATRISQQLAQHRFKVIDNLNVIPTIRKHAPKLAARIPARIQAERLLVACNAPAIVGYMRTNLAATSLCPLTISLVQENGQTTAYYLERSAVRPGAPARAVDRAVLASLHAAQVAGPSRLRP